MDLTVPGFEGTVDLGFSFPADGPLAFMQAVDPAFFETVRLPLRLGRPLTQADVSGAPRVVVVNETLARTYFPGRSAIGEVFKIGGDDDAPEATIVGVVADMPFDSLRRDVPPTFFGSYLQEPDLEGVTFEVRTTTPPLDLVPAVRAAVRQIEPRLPLAGLMSEEQQIADSYREERVYATLAVTIGAVGLLLAAIGLYGLLAYQVAQRTQELGLRMALGATRGRLARLVLVQSFRLATVGAVLGLAASLAATRVLGDILFGLTATDPATLAAAVVVLLAVAVLAGYLPARHAARVDPLVALRTE
jgi:predicted permease